MMARVEVAYARAVKWLIDEWTTTEDEPQCPRCDSAQAPERLRAGWYFCPCCASIFRWPRPADEQTPDAG